MANRITTARRQTSKDEFSSDLYDQPGHLLRRAQQISVSLFFDELDAGITPIQYAVLRTVKEYPGVDQVTIAGLVAIDKSTAATVAIRLEEKGLLTRDKDPNDRRQRQLHLTVKGDRLLDSLVPAVHRLRDRILKPFTATEKKQFVTLLAKLVQLTNSESRAPLSDERPQTAAKRKPATQSKPT
jgi:DNA-binding MarR family transcriptional regulator